MSTPISQSERPDRDGTQCSSSTSASPLCFPQTGHPWTRAVALLALLLIFDGMLLAHEVTLETKLNRMGVRVVEQSRFAEGLFYVVAFAYLAVSIVAAGVCGLWAIDNSRHFAFWCTFGFFFHFLAIPTLLVVHVRSVGNRRNKDTVRE